MKRQRRTRRNVVIATLATLLTLAMSGCSGAPSSSTGAGYLASIEQAHRADAKAVAVCKADSGRPVLPGAPREKILVAANSSLSFVRQLQGAGFAARTGDGALTGTQEGYAAICLVGTVNDGKKVRLWEYALPDRHTGPIDAG